MGAKKRFYTHRVLFRIFFSIFRFKAENEKVEREEEDEVVVKIGLSSVYNLSTPYSQTRRITQTNATQKPIQSEKCTRHGIMRTKNCELCELREVRNVEGNLFVARGVDIHTNRTTFHLYIELLFDPLIFSRFVCFVSFLIALVGFVGFSFSFFLFYFVLSHHHHQYRWFGS